MATKPIRSTADVPGLDAALSAGNRFCFFGNSLPAMSLVSAPAPGGTPPSTAWPSNGYWWWAQMWFGYRGKLVRNAGVGGDKAYQCVARMEADVFAHRDEFDWLHIDIGHNDVTGGVDNTPRTTAEITGHLHTIISRALSLGKRVSIATITPSVNYETAAKRRVLFEVNDWIRAYPQVNPGVVVCDFFAAVSSLTDATPAANMTSDGVHDGYFGAAVKGRVMGQTLAPYLAGQPLLLGSNNDPRNMLTNGMMTGSTGGLATGWSVSALDGGSVTYTTSKVARTDGVRGEWQQVVSTAGKPQLYAQNTNVGTDWNVGDTVYARVEFDLDTTTARDISSLLAKLNFHNGTGSSLSITKGGADPANQSGLGIFPTRGVLETPRMVVPASTTRLQLLLQMPELGTYRFARAAIYKV